MTRQLVLAVTLALPALAPAQAAGAGSASAAVGAPIDWDKAFVDESGSAPVHFVATYADANGKPHRLEEWRVGQQHLRRLTDARIDLHADAAGVARAGQPTDYVWQILDLQTRIDHRVSTRGMMRMGMLYSYYAMAHGLSRPTGVFEVHALLPGTQPATMQGQRVVWFQIETPGQPRTRVAWNRTAGVPMLMQQQNATTWATTFTLQQVDRQAIAPAIFRVNAAGFQIRNVDEDEAED